MAKLTRSEVVQRALDWFSRCGYIWGGYPGNNAHCHMGDDGKGVSGSGPYIATDCSGYVSWAWGIGYHANSSYWGPTGTFGGGNYRPRTGHTGVIEQDFPGIQPGDVLWKNGHVVLYVGNNTTVEASTSQWDSTATGTGMVRRTGARNDLLGYSSYDGTYSEDYDPDLYPDVSEWFPPRGPDHPSENPWEDDDQHYTAGLYLEDRYTKRYKLMKQWRSVK